MSKNPPMKPRSQVRKKFWVCMEYFLLTMGILVLVVDAAALSEGRLRSHALLGRFQALHHTAEKQDEHGDVAQVSRAISSSDLIPRPRVIAAQSDDVMAVVHVPRLSISVPLLDGTDALTLNRAVGHIPGTALPGEPGNIGIAGHRDSFFRGLKEIRAGDVIELQQVDGVDTYIVDEIQIVVPGNVSVLRPKNVPSITLVTCYPFHFIGSAPKRFVVTASLATGPLTRKVQDEVHPPTPNPQFQKEN